MREDYLLRLLEEWGSLWRRLIRLSDIKDYQTSLQEIDASYGKLFGYNAKFIDLLSDQDLLNLTKQAGVIASDRCFVLAALLTAEGDQYAGLHQFEESYWRYERATLLWRALLATGREPDAETITKIEETIHKLRQYNLSDIGGWALVDVYSALGQYGQAEDVLYELLTIYEYNQQAVERALEWYARLQEVDADSLIAGDLLPEDIIEGHAHLTQVHNSTPESL